MKPDLIPEVVELPRGEYLMGETPQDKFATDTERPARRVSFQHRFALGRFPVTCEEYEEFDGPAVRSEEARLPLVNVSWHEATDYCQWLGAQTGQPFRLPTEAEWEYACRAGVLAPFSTGDELPAGSANYLYDESGHRIGPGARTAVDAYPANAFGLHDLHGNVCEWVEDSWHPNYLGAPTDGSAWIDEGGATLRVIRGGAWDYLPRLLRTTWRDSLPQNTRRDNVGFRIAVTLPTKTCAS